VTGRRVTLNEWLDDIFAVADWALALEHPIDCNRQKNEQWN
jgi:hypothetical protein